MKKDRFEGIPASAFDWKYSESATPIHKQEIPSHLEKKADKEPMKRKVTEGKKNTEAVEKRKKVVVSNLDLKTRILLNLLVQRNNQPLGIFLSELIEREAKKEGISVSY